MWKALQLPQPPANRFGTTNYWAVTPIAGLSEQETCVVKATERARGRTLVVAVVNSGMMEMAVNWALNMKRQGVQRFLVVAIDKSGLQQLRAHNIPAILASTGWLADKDASWLASALKADTLQKYQQGRYSALTRLKVLVARAFLTHGYTVFFHDVDIGWAGSTAFKDFEDFAHERHCQLAIMTDHTDLKQPQENWNTGLFIARPRYHTLFVSGVPCTPHTAAARSATLAGAGRRHLCAGADEPAGVPRPQQEVQAVPTGAAVRAGRDGGDDVLPGAKRGEVQHGELGLRARGGEGGLPPQEPRGGGHPRQLGALPRREGGLPEALRHVAAAVQQAASSRRRDVVCRPRAVCRHARKLLLCVTNARNGGTGQCHAGGGGAGEGGGATRGAARGAGSAAAGCGNWLATLAWRGALCSAGGGKRARWQRSMGAT